MNHHYQPKCPVSKLSSQIYLTRPELALFGRPFGMQGEGTVYNTLQKGRVEKLGQGVGSSKKKRAGIHLRTMVTTFAICCK